MLRDYEKLFGQLETPEVPGDLLEKITARIQKEKSLLVIKRRLVLIFVAAIASITTLVPAFNMVRTDLAESGFLQFLSLMFYDFKIIIIHWQTFTMSLSETIPAISLAIFLGVILAFLWSLKLLSRDIKIIYGYRQNFAV